MKSLHMKSLWLITLIFCITTNKGFAQKEVPRLFTGKVIASDMPLAGVQVEVQERNRKTFTDADGSFSILAEPTDILIFYKNDFTTVQRKAGDAQGLIISLVPSKIGGGEEDEVIIPFGVRKSREVTYAVGTVKGSDLPQLPIGSLTPILGGRLAGLYIQQTSNGPGNDNGTLQIRGRSTYNSGNNPRVLVDGIFRDYSDLDINEIESFTVLKDAAALTWYGLNAANGILMITTKKGSNKRTSINFDSQTGLQQSANNVQSLNSFQFANLYNEALSNGGRPAIYNQAALSAYQNNSDPFNFPNNNYKGEFLRESAPIFRNVISATGGSNSFRYFTLLGYYNQKGNFKSTETDDFDSQLKFQRINFRVNLDYDLNSNLTVGLDAAARTGNLREPLDGASGLLSDLYNLPPNAFPILNQNGTFGGTSIYQNNPLGRLQGRGYVRNLTRALIVNANVKYKMNFVTPGLSANFLVSYDTQGSYQSGLTKNYEVTDLTINPPITYRTSTPLNYLSSSFSANNRRNEIWAGVDYERSFKGDHKINSSLRFMRSVDNAVERLDFRGQQISARVDYGFKDRYFFGLVSSYAGSENFAPNRRYGFFPAVSAGWIASEETFLKDNSTINYLKFRASYGIMGNGDIGGARLPFRSLYRAPAGFGYAFGTGFAATVSADEISPAGNPLITWEKLNRFNVGTDVQLLNKALTLSVDYFDDKRSDILTTPRVPSILGITLTGINEGKVNSKGVEGSVNYERQFNEFNFSLNGNYTYAKNEVISINEDRGIPAYQSSIGLNTGNVSLINTKRFYVSDGLFQNQAQVNSSPTQGPAGVIKPGDIKYKDINNDGVINGLDAINTDYTDIPKSYYGFGFNVKYKFLQVNTQFQGVTGRSVQIKSIVNSGPLGFNELSLNRWTPETASTAKFPRLAVADRANNNLDSDFWIRSGDFLKLRTVELSFSLPEKLIKKVNVQKARIYLTGYNLMSFTKLDIDVDPEMPYAGYGSSYPNLKTYSLGLNVQF
ncbi:SusC/RagA family TonB-linked outer membrane protein [Daejeonella sp.]|uniref:SusC/RagA family TonB-linked outer membrane protein n=1 Tax=Daejeonella sp. TaxID=2805397 RepID=UPI0039837D53